MSNIYLISNDINLEDSNFIKFNGDYLYLPLSNLPLSYYSFANLKTANINDDLKKDLSNHIRNINKPFKPYNTYNIPVISNVLILIWILLILIIMRILYIKYNNGYSYILVGIIITLLVIINFWYLLTINQNI